MKTFGIKKILITILSCFIMSFAVPNPGMADPATDLDQDALPDTWEIAFFGNIDRYSGQDDPDGDRIINLMELENGTSPTDFNTGNLRLTGDLTQSHYGSGGKIYISDAEVDDDITTTFHANKNIIISSETRFEEGAEIRLLAGDGDRLADEWEMARFGTLEYDDNDDPDHNGISNYNEFILTLTPVVSDPDSDEDGLEDEWELAVFGSLDQGKDDDFDQDGYKNFSEKLLNTNPADADDHPAPGNYYEYDALGRVKKIIRIQ